MDFQNLPGTKVLPVVCLLYSPDPEQAGSRQRRVSRGQAERYGLNMEVLCPSAICRLHDPQAELG